MDYPDNPFNILQYFKCCIHQASPDIELSQDLLNKLEAHEKAINNNMKFYTEAQTLYYKLIEKDINKAIDYLKENSYAFDNKIYYYKNLFDLYEENRDIANMENTFNDLKREINDDFYDPILLRRKFTLMYFKGKKYDNIITELNLSGIGDYAKRQITKHLDYLFK
ncbi:MAG: hypothetical protein LUI60_02610 [Clostridia bacterium]|nr:hypothetical protein [Clostridia bacterium]